jgi:hypothetical protein
MSPVFVFVDRPHRAWVWFILQCLLVPITVEVAAFCPTFLGAATLKAWSPVVEDVAGWVLIVVIGVSLALGAAKFEPRLLPSGQWVWIPLAIFFVLGFISDLTTLPQYFGGNYLQVAAMYLYETGDDEGARLTFITYPLFATASYSVGCLLARLFRNGQQERRIRRDPPREG